MTLPDEPLPIPDPNDPHSPPEQEGWPRWGRRFLDSLRRTRCVTDAAEAVGRDRSTIYKAWERSPSFRAACQEVLDAGNERLESSAWDLAINGSKEPIFDGSLIVGIRKKRYPDLMRFLLLGQQLKRARSRKTEPDPAAIAKAISELLAKMRASVPPPDRVEGKPERIPA